MNIKTRVLTGAALAAVAVIASGAASAATVLTDSMGQLVIDPTTSTGSLSASTTLSYNNVTGAFNYLIVNNPTSKESGSVAATSGASVVDYEFTIATPVDLLYGQTLNTVTGNHKLLGGATLQLKDLTAGVDLTPVIGFSGSGTTSGYTVNLTSTTDVYALEVSGLVPARTGTTATSKYDVEYSPSVFAQAVPEPATWGVMLLGFGAIGASLRTSRRKAVAAA